MVVPVIKRGPGVDQRAPITAGTICTVSRPRAAGKELWPIISSSLSNHRFRRNNADSVPAAEQWTRSLPVQGFCRGHGSLPVQSSSVCGPGGYGDQVPPLQPHSLQEVKPAPSGLEQILFGMVMNRVSLPSRGGEYLIWGLQD